MACLGERRDPESVELLLISYSSQSPWFLASRVVNSSAKRGSAFFFFPLKTVIKYPLVKQASSFYIMAFFDEFNHMIIQLIPKAVRGLFWTFWCF